MNNDHGFDLLEIVLWAGMLALVLFILTVKRLPAETLDLMEWAHQVDVVYPLPRDKPDVQG